MNNYERYDEYVENLLKAQFDVSGIFSHKLVQGEVREDFIKTEINKQYKDLQIEKGIISNMSEQSGQIDLIICDKSSRIRKIGKQALVDVNDCRLVFEVKTRAYGTEFKEFNEKSKVIKNLGSNPRLRTGLFCYKLGVKKATILKRFGYSYDKQIKTFEFDVLLQEKYPSIDFVLCLDDEIDEDGENKNFFLLRDLSSKKYDLFLQHPVSHHFFLLLNSIV